jgi:hypothetical protein
MGTLASHNPKAPQASYSFLNNNIIIIIIIIIIFFSVIRHFRKQKREYLKEKINEPAKNSNIKNSGDLYRGINHFKRGYQPRNNLEFYAMWLL